MRIARLIRRWIAEKEPLVSAGRAIRPGDILILVRRRDPFTAPMIRALKRECVPVAGADRMRLMDQLAVQDLVALAQVLLMTDDDLSLAIVLKSPLFGLDDAALFDLAHGRTKSLWRTLKEKAGTDARFAEAWHILSGWLARADFLPPYEFFCDVLAANNQSMRKRMLKRLGPEAAEAIDEFLERALLYDREAAPSLQGFIQELAADDSEIKRDMEQERDEVRIMTVHGAKGLEAPIVFLPDTCMLPRRQGPRLYGLVRPGEPPGEVDHVVWATGGQDLGALAPAKSALRAADLEEYHRLLYVAMTRARDRLYVCGFQGTQKRPEGSWYELLSDGLQNTMRDAQGSDGMAVRRMDSAQDAMPPASVLAPQRPAAPPLPGWAERPAPKERVRAVLTPSGLGGPGRAEAAEQSPLGPAEQTQGDRFARGRLVHALLQHLPDVAVGAREDAARAFVQARGRELPEALRQEIVAETLAVLADPAFAPLFGPKSLAEVPIVARIGEGEEASRAHRPDRPAGGAGGGPARARLQDQPAAPCPPRGGRPRLHCPARGLSDRPSGAVPRASLARGAAVDRRAETHGNSINFA